MLRSIGQNPTEEEILNLVIEYDVNGDGTIDFEEFLEMMAKQAEGMDHTAEIREAFKIFDRDGNGYVDAKELKQVQKNSVYTWGASNIGAFLGNIGILSKTWDFLLQVVTRMGQVLTQDEAEEFLTAADLNGDGKLDYDEFAKIMSMDL